MYLYPDALVFPFSYPDEFNVSDISSIEDIEQFGDIRQVVEIGQADQNESTKTGVLNLSHFEPCILMDSCSNNCEAHKLAEMDYALWTDYLGDYIAMWQRNSIQFIQEQQQKMLGMAMCPFLFGVTLNLPEAWIKLLYNNGIVERDRANMRTSLTESEMEMSEMAEVIFRRCYQLVENKSDLKTILNYIYDVEERSKQGSIDLNFALDEIGNKEIFKSMCVSQGVSRSIIVSKKSIGALFLNRWLCLAPLRKTYEHKKKKASICFIYFFKTIHQHLVFYGRDGVDKAEFTKKLIADRNSHKKEVSIDKEITFKQGNTALKEGNSKRALELFTALVETDPLNSQHYSNRAQANLQLKNYWEAYCDNKRALLLDRSSYKNYYQAAKLYIEFGQFDKAEEMNKLALRFVKDHRREHILKQAQEIDEAKKKMSNARLGDMLSSKKEKGKENEPPEVVPADEFHNVLQHIIEAYNSSRYNKSLNLCNTALSLISLNGLEITRANKDDLLMLNYVHAMSSIYTSLNIPSAIERLKCIKETDRCIAAYYGLGVGYLMLHSFNEAQNYLTCGLDILRNESKYAIWPMALQSLNETEPNRLDKLINEKLKECLPPKPDGVCRYHVDQDKKSIEIYKQAPDYKGFIRLQCTANCVIDFHKSCWKTYKQNFGDKITDKEMLDIKCPTPECWGFICNICISLPSTDVKQFTSTQTDEPPKEPKPKLKTKAFSPRKIQTKCEKKRLRKERRAQARLAALETKPLEAEENVTTEPPHEVLPDVSQIVAPDCQVTLLKKDDPELLVSTKQKSMKVKKKKEKVKNFLTVDLQFAGDDERTRLSAYSLEEEQESEAAIPPPGISNGAVSGTNPSSSDQQFQLPKPGHDNYKTGLFQLFANLLKNESLIDLNGHLVFDILQNLAPESRQEIESVGGLAQFMCLHPSFIVINNRYLGLKDSTRSSKPTVSKPFSWENRKKQSEINDFTGTTADSKKPLPLVDTLKPLTLNPAAKEFFPPSLKEKKGGYNDLDTFELPSYALAEKEDSDEANGGFITVGRKLPKLGDKLKPVPSMKSSYHSLDEITLTKSAKSSKVSSVEAIAKEPEEDYVTSSMAPPHSDASDLSGDRSISPASTSSSLDKPKVQAPSPMPLKVPKISLPSRGKKSNLTTRLTSRPLMSLATQRLPQSGESSISSSIAADDDDRESLASTSDKDSITDQAKLGSGVMWPGKVNSNNGSVEKEQASLSELKKPVRRDLFDSGVDSCPNDGSLVPFTTITAQQNVFDANIWSTRAEPLKDVWLAQSSFFPSFSQDSSVPSFSTADRQPPIQKSRVLSQIAENQGLDNSFSISADAELRNVWSKGDEGNASWTGKGSTLADMAATHQTSTPLKLIEQQTLPGQGPWLNKPDVSTSSLLQSSALVSLESNTVSWMLSRLKPSIGDQRLADSVQAPQNDLPVVTKPPGFSRTPGKRNNLAVTSSRAERSSQAEAQFRDVDHTSYQYAEPFPSASFPDSSDSSLFSYHNELQNSSTQTEGEDNQENQLSSYNTWNSFNKFGTQGDSRALQALQQELSKERIGRQAAEREVKTERSRWLERHKDIARKNIKILDESLASTRQGEDKFSKLIQKKTEWLHHYELCNECLVRSETLSHLELVDIDLIMDSLQQLSAPILIVMESPIQKMELPKASIIPDHEVNSLPAESYRFESLDRSNFNDSIPSAAKRAGGSMPKIAIPKTSTIKSPAPSIVKHGLPIRPLMSIGLMPKPSASLTQQSQTSLEKIVQTIQETFPNYPRNAILKIIGEMRKANGGTLSDFSEIQLSTAIADKIIEDSAGQASGHTAFSSEESLSGQGPRNTDCSICHETIHFEDALTLDCHHKFHEMCIQKWLEEERSCPNCRKYVLLKEEFPSLR